MASTKPENQFIASVNRKLPRTHCEKTCNPYRSGTADVWYSGHLGDLWIEYKYIPRIPRSAEILPELTPRQLRWLDSRYKEGRNVAVVVGTPTGGVIYRNQEWSLPLAPDVFTKLLAPRDEIAQWIYSQVGERVDDSIQDS